MRMRVTLIYQKFMIEERWFAIYIFSPERMFRKKKKRQYIGINKYDRR